jgi:hypothetical protein
MLDQISAAAVAAGRPADAVRAIYSVPVRIGPRAHTTKGLITGSAGDIVEQLHALTGLGFTGFDLMPVRSQIRAIAEEVLPALRELPAPAPQAQAQASRRSPYGPPTVARLVPQPRPAPVSPVG